MRCLQPALSRQLLDLCFLVGSALLVCVICVGAFIVVIVRHMNPAWVFLSFISILFFAWAGEEYRKEFRSIRFIFFVCSWIVINMFVFVVILVSFGWFWLFPALFL